MADESLRDALSQVSYYHSPESRISDAKIELKGMEQTRAGDSQSPAEADTNHDTRSRPSAVKKKVVRRDPAKRRLQNRLAQKTYREKQRKRIQELERRAGGSGPEAHAGPPPGSNDTQMVVRAAAEPATNAGTLNVETVNPSQLQAGSGTSTSQSTEDIWGQDLLSATLDQWLSENPIGVDENQYSMVYFNCGCPILHIPNHSSHVLLPVIPDPYMNTLRIDIICVVSAMLQNCLQLGITHAMYCSEDAISPFYRPHTDAEPGQGAVVSAVQRGFRALHYDLRPTHKQIVIEHHPFLDVIPFKEIRDNIIDNMDNMDEDEFFHDSLNHLTCWGSVAGAHTGSPWDARSWEATEMFLQKWSHIVGGEDGELTRNSRWWRSLRGERVVTEVM
ncbi:BZIP domain-containing protein [Fusarium falciforme]|uniref:BZIP domain-containing protein n=1 Tax=Fusarium falciforme TaxID=195108 RepID=UPI002300BBD2|nr:BZIP domain-containing protein [Fusarium falciforme]WAO88390.1 BZIP domain-containing protein [Fusarium falciforme]